jgi:hypothetical protein
MKPTFDPGTISHGTLNPVHLLSAYIQALEGFTLISGDYFSRHHDERDRIADKIGEMQDCFNEDGTDIDEEKEDASNWLLNEEVPDLLNEYAPAGYSFSSHPGDGSDVGFWQNEEGEEEPQPMNKADELEALAAFRRTLPADPLHSYLGNWIDAISDTLASDIKNDIFPTATPAQTRDECRKIKEEATEEAARIIKRAEDKAQEIKDKAERDAGYRAKYTSEAVRALENAIRKLENI